MPKTSGFEMWKLLLCSFVCIFLLLTPDALSAKNAPVSNWLINVSEGITGSGDLDTAAEFAIVGNTAHVVWISRDKDWKYHLNYKRSIDGGITWQSKIELYAAAENSLNQPTYKKLAVTSTTVHIAVNTYGTKSTWYGKLLYFRSTNNGASFEQARELFSAAEAWHVYDLFAVADGTKLTIGFRNQCNWCVNNSFVLLNSDDQGSSFTQRTAYSTDKGSGWHVWDLLRKGDNIYLVYTDQYYYYGLQSGDLYFGASSNAGATFTSQKISIPSKNGNHKAYGSQDNNYVPKIAADGTNVSVVWCGLDGNDIASTFYRRSVNNGVTFAPVVNLTQNAIPNNEPLHAGQETVTMKGNYVYVLMLVSDDRSYSRIYLRRSIDGGVSFKDMQKLTAVDGSYGVDGGWWPTIQIDPSDATGARVHILWNGPLYCASADAGATFTKYALLAPTFSTSNTAARPKLGVGLDGTVHSLTEAAIWTKATGTGDTDIFYRRLTASPTQSGNTALKLATIDNYSASSEYQRFDNMQISPSSWINFTSAMTVEAWIKPNRKDNTAGLFVSKMDGTKSAVPSYAMGQWTDGKLWAKIATATNWYEIYGQGPVIPNNVWSHVVMSYDANGGTGSFKVYVNGQLAGSTTVAGNLATDGGILFVGGISGNSMLPRYDAEIVIDELRLWNRALSQSEIAANMNRALQGTESGLAAYYPLNNSTKDMTGHGNDGVFMYRETFVDGYAMPNPVPKKDLLGTWAGQGSYSRNTDTGAWTYLTSAATQISAGDMDGDGIDDLIGLWSGSGVWVKYSTTGQWAYLASSAEWIAAGDFNADGKKDLAGIWGGVIYIRDSATGAWTAVSSGANMLTAGDLDGDKKDDLIANWSGNAVWVRYSSNGQWTSLATSADWIASDDTNGDGKADLIGIWSASVWVRDSATGSWTSPTAGANQVAAGDFDGDGKADLVGNFPGSGIWVKYTSSGSWERLSSSADWIAVGRLH